MIHTGRFDNSVEARKYYCCDKDCEKETWLVFQNRANCDELEYQALRPGATRVTFGIHPEQIKQDYWKEPFRQEIFTFCGYHGMKFCHELICAIAHSLNKWYFLSRPVTNDFRNNLPKILEKWVIGFDVDMPDYIPGYGHWISFISDGFLRFSFQVVEPIFNSVIEVLPELFGISHCLCSNKERVIPQGIFPPKYFEIDSLLDMK